MRRPAAHERVRSIARSTVDRAARIAKLFIDLNLDGRRARIGDEQVRAIVAAMDKGLRVAFPDATLDERSLWR